MKHLMLRSQGIAALVALTMMGAPILSATRGFADEVSVTDRPAVGLVLLDKLMSGRSHVGDRVHFETLAPVCGRDGRVLVPAGCMAIGRVMRSKGSGMFGKRGELQFTCEYVILPDGTHVPLMGSRDGGAGTNDVATMAAVTVLVSPLGLLIKGGTITFDRGTPIEMYIADGAVVTPGYPGPSEIRADFAPNAKHAPDIIGHVESFDGDTYTIRTGSGEQRIGVRDIASVEPQDTVSAGE